MRNCFLKKLMFVLTLAFVVCLSTSLMACISGSSAQNSTCNHKLVVDEAIDATCESIGLTSGVHCSLCEAVLTKQEVVPALGHNYENGACSRCGKQDPSVTTHEHTVVIDEAVAPTCTATGLTEGKHCSVCNEVLVAQTVVKALGHTEVRDNAVAPTCTATGLTKGKHCSVCNEVLVKQEVLPVAHVYEDSNQCSVCEYISTKYFTFTLLSDDTYEIKTKDVNNIPANIVIPDSFEGKAVTSIGWHAFYNCDSLTSVVIGDSVTSIGESAFYNCSLLTSITVSENNANYSSLNGNLYNKDKTTLIQYAIGKTDSKFIIPDSVTSIGNYAFYKCSSLTEVNYLGTIDKWAEIEFGNSFANPLYYTKQLKINGEVVTEVNLTTATKISNYAFYYCSSLTSVVIPDSVTSIGDYAFRYCYSLTSVVIGEGITSIGYEAFSGCSGLTEVNYLGTIDNWVQIEFSDSLANPLYYTKQLRINGEVVTEVNLTTATKISNYAFYNCSSLTSVEIGDSVTSIGYGAFGGCSSLQSITIPFVGTVAGKTLSDTYQYPFGYIFGTSSYTGGTATKQYYYGSSTSSTTSSIYYIPTSLKQVTVTGGNILYGAFYNCDSLTSIEIPDSVTSIGDQAFYYCDGLTSIEIPDSVTSIGGWAFRACSSLTSVVIPNSVTSIGDYAFSSCNSLTSVVIPDSVTSIGDFAFASCRSLTSVVIPDSVTSIGDSAFNGCSGLEFNVHGNGLYLGNENNPFIALIKGSNTAISTLEVHQDAKIIADYAFYNYERLTSVVIGDSVTSIGSFAFYNCRSLTSVVIGDSVTSIGSDAFSSCDSLTSIEIPDSVTSIGEDAFKGCSSLTSVVIGDSVTSIGDYAFSSCDNLTSVVIGDSVTSIGDYAFYYCSNLTSVVIPNSVTSIGDYAFHYCSNLTSIEIPDSVTSIGSGAFACCGSLTSVVIPDSVTSIGSYAFAYCDGLTSITVSENNANYSSLNGNLYNKDKTTLIQYAIGKTDSKFIIPDSVTSIGDAAFSSCDSLTSIESPDSVTSIGSSAFSSCSSLTSVVIPNSVTSIGSSAFDYCSNLKEVNYLGTIDQWAEIEFDGYYANPLYYAKQLKINGEVVTEVNLTSATKVSKYSFYNCDNLTSVVIGDSVTSIGDRAFSGCSSLTSIVIGDSVTSIGDRAFYNCDNLTSVVIGDSVTSIGDYAFSRCSSLSEVYYKGDAEGWKNITIGSSNSHLKNATRYYYSESEPSEEGNFWHYDENGVIVEW